MHDIGWSLEAQSHGPEVAHTDGPTHGLAVLQARDSGNGFVSGSHASLEVHSADRVCIPASQLVEHVLHSVKPHVPVYASHLGIALSCPYEHVIVAPFGVRS